METVALEIAFGHRTLESITENGQDRSIGLMVNALGNETDCPESDELAEVIVTGESLVLNSEKECVDPSVLLMQVITLQTKPRVGSESVARRTGGAGSLVVIA